jgi:hypothetical protein
MVKEQYKCTLVFYLSPTDEYINYLLDKGKIEDPDDIDFIPVSVDAIKTVLDDGTEIFNTEHWTFMTDKKRDLIAINFTVDEPLSSDEKEFIDELEFYLEKFGYNDREIYEVIRKIREHQKIPPSDLEFPIRLWRDF